MATARNDKRPLSPHLSIWKWGPAMAASIINRVTGSGMATVGAGLMVWWLVALASGREAYDCFLEVFTTFDGGLNIIGYVVGIGLTYSLFQHMAGGVRHFFLDVGANFELKSNKTSALATFVFATVATLAFWLYMTGVL